MQSRVKSGDSGMSMMETQEYDGTAPGRYRTYGYSLESSFPFKYYLGCSHDDADIVFTLGDRVPDNAFDASDLLCGAPSDEERRIYAVSMHRGALFHVGNVADFSLEEGHIHCRPLGRLRCHLVELCLLGPVFSFWLERQGLSALHASAVAVDGRAVAFLSSNKGGKSCLAAAMMAAGYPLLSDDILAVSVQDGMAEARPSYPQMRLWPAEAEHFLGTGTALEEVYPGFPKLRVPVGEGGFGAFHHQPCPLSRIFLPQRRPPEETGGGIIVAPLTPGEALLELLGHSFLSDMVDGPDWRAEQLVRLGRVVTGVPVYRLFYPDGFQYLPFAAEAVADELRRI
ncbi:MAG: hypothetical protein PHT33_05570 [bacterium]|nr:hypothetical protein [bacterium]